MNIKTSKQNETDSKEKQQNKFWKRGGWYWVWK